MTAECLLCQAVDDPIGGVEVRVKSDGDGVHYTVCDVCDPQDGGISPAE